MEHTSTGKFVNVHEQIVRIQQRVLDVQSDVQRDEATFAQINQAYQQVWQCDHWTGMKDEKANVSFLGTL